MSNPSNNDLAARLSRAEENVACITQATTAAMGVQPGPPSAPPSRGNGNQKRTAKNPMEGPIAEGDEGNKDGAPIGYDILLDGELMTPNNEDGLYQPGEAEPEPKGKGHKVTTRLGEATGDSQRVGNPADSHIESITTSDYQALQLVDEHGLMTFQLRFRNPPRGEKTHETHFNNSFCIVCAEEGHAMIQMQGEINKLYLRYKWAKGAALLAYFTNKFLREPRDSAQPGERNPTPGPRNRCNLKSRPPIKNPPVQPRERIPTPPPVDRQIPPERHMATRRSPSTLIQEDFSDPLHTLPTGLTTTLW
ncbi:uncharacterized protein MELLADRAFT_89329 [Melampsora larici-populina 98AG31]|uniref:Uncharacterized protein n=1 Tax=Melampsora larici-populina (strain 98AG31 / pathotype 3-4-7) TaxID=747676 RepID=F4R5R7_MELLP|nr:uncharacterized protein MELLADRAFT_89329 [Melampsora larici-populina 98AG31]EGG12090.1 hypothetical protein MELLADRAFT_89329 [Melampsora larici-populina 98AG31]